MLHQLLKKQNDATFEDQHIFCCKTTIKPSGESPKIINLCSKPLTERQINLLRRGLKFTPTPKPNTVELPLDGTHLVAVRGLIH